MKKNLSILSILTIIFLLHTFESKSAEVCDSLRWCIGRTLQFTVTSGKGAQYADITNNKLIKKT